MKAFLRKLMRDPFTHFIVIGGFAFMLLNSSNNSGVIRLSEGYLQAQKAQFQRQIHKSPTPQETRQLLQAAVEEEALYQEGLKLKLGQHDPVVRKRIIQKMRFVLEGQSKPHRPSLQELQEYLVEHLEEFREPVRYTFRHVYYRNESKIGERPTTNYSDFETIKLRSEADPFILGNDFKSLTFSDISSKFGSQFATAFVKYAEQPQGKDVWFGPVSSRYGAHIIKVLEIHPSQRPDFEAVRDKVYNAWMKLKTRNNKSDAIERILANYHIDLPIANR